MTIKELYKWALDHNSEDAELLFYNESNFTQYPFNYIEASKDKKEVYLS